TTKAAVEEGIVPGGGVALLWAQQSVAKTDLEGDEATGGRIVSKALEDPVKQTATNAGLEGGVVVERIRSENTAGFGLNAATGEFSDLSKAGVVDAATGTRWRVHTAALTALR